MNFTDSKHQHHMNQTFHSKWHHLHTHHHQQHHHFHCSQTRPHSRQQLLLLSRSPVALVSILILSSALILPSCRALDSLSQSGVRNSIDGGSSSSSSSRSVLTTGGGRYLKRTILPFHFKLLQDYLHQHGIGSDERNVRNDIRYPVEMLFPPGVRIMSRSNSYGPLWRSRRSVPLRSIEISLRSKSYNNRRFQNQSPDTITDGEDRFVPSVPTSQNKMYPEARKFMTSLYLQQDIGPKRKSPGLKPKGVLNSDKFARKSVNRYLKKLRQKQEIKDALRRRDKARWAARKDRISASHSPQIFPPLAEASFRALQKLKSIQSQKAFVRKQKSQKSLAAAAFLANEGRSQDFENEPFDPFQSPPNIVQHFYDKDFSGDNSGYLNGVKIKEPDMGLGKAEWFVSSSDSSPLLSATEAGDFFSAPISPSDSKYSEAHDTLAFENGLGSEQGFSGLSFTPSGSEMGEDFGSSSSISGASGFGPPATFSGTGGSIVTSSFGSPSGDGFGTFWGEGAFSTNDKDCADVETKACLIDSDCSCFGFYTCSSENRCVSTKGQQMAGTEIWHEGPVDFGLSKRLAMQSNTLQPRTEPQMPGSELHQDESHGL